MFIERDLSGSLFLLLPLIKFIYKTITIDIIYNYFRKSKKYLNKTIDKVELAVYNIFVSVG